MATPQFNFNERDLDRWVKDTLQHLAEDPEALPNKTGEAWAQDRGGPSSVPGLRIRIRLHKGEASNWSLRDPAVSFYLVKKIQGKKFTSTALGK